MIKVTKDISRIKRWNDESIYVVTDFDHTITNDFSESSWAILAKCDLLPEKYTEECYDQYNYYHPIEMDENIQYDEKHKLMVEWWNAHINLFVKYKLTEEIVKKAAISRMPFREGAKEFLENLYKRNIPVIIISAGVGNFIEMVLKDNDCYYDNIYLISNFIEFKDGVAAGIKGEIIHSLNKNKVTLPDTIKNRDNVILLGDYIQDIYMVSDEKREEALKIGFYFNEKIRKETFDNCYDVVCTDNASYDMIRKEIDL